MKSDKFKISGPLIVGIVIAIMIGIGIARRYRLEKNSELIEKYVRPGNDTLSVAIEMSPLTYTFRNDTAEGFDYLMLKDITEKHHIPVVFHPFAQLDDAFQGLYDGEYDLLVASIPSTKALKDFFPLTDAVYIDKQVLVQLKDSLSEKHISTQLELRGDTVWIPEGSPVQSRLRNLAHELGDTIVVVSDPRYSAEQLGILTALGNVRQAVINEAVARKIAKEYPALDISTPVSFSQFQCWAVAPGDSILLDSLNTWLSQFKETETFQMLSQRYL